MGRRAFVRTAAQASAALFAGAAVPPGASAQGTLRIGVVGRERDAAVRSMARGVSLGVEEAARTGGLVGRTIDLVSMHGEGTEALAAVADQVHRRGLAAVVGGWDPRSCRALSAVTAANGALYLNTGCTADALRGEECRRNTFHVQASDAMISSALGDPPPDAGEAAGAVVWHPSLERYGAAQLNARYRARFTGEEMDGPAWAGWMAVKVLWEASLRARSTAPAALGEYLERESTQFDGHKGWPLSFRPWDHQLRQPLYLVAAAEEGRTRVVGEVPGRSGENASRTMLDTLGEGQDSSPCAFTG